MSASLTANWLERLQSSQKTAIVQDGRRKVHYTFADGLEMCEEYDMSSYELIKRKLRFKTTLGGYSQWQTEIGEDDGPRNLDPDGLVESTSNPIFTRKDRKDQFVWRVRNLPYPIETYSISVDADQRQFVIRTTNKKYYKKFSVPDLDRLQLPLEESRINKAHANNTLIISYAKPPEVMKMEENLRRELKKVKSNKEGDVECNPS